MPLQESGEMYLETIFILSEQDCAVRGTDIANKLGYSKASVSRGISILKKNELVSVDKDGAIKLTEKGRKIAEDIYEKHKVVTKFFMQLGVNEKTAEADACRIEHVLSDATFNAIKKQLKK